MERTLRPDQAPHACTCGQVRSIMGQVRPDRQTLLFSATMPNKVERLVADALTSPVRITVGEVGAANTDIRQVPILAPLLHARGPS
jgi:ATP-dependent RNA helicase DDX42